MATVYLVSDYAEHDISVLDACFSQRLCNWNSKFTTMHCRGNGSMLYRAVVLLQVPSWGKEDKMGSNNIRIFHF